MKKIAVFATSFLQAPISHEPGIGTAAGRLEDLASRLGGPWQIAYRCERPPSDELKPEDFKDVVAVIADLECYRPELLKSIGIGSGGTVELIVRYGVGYDSVDLPSATNAGILIANTPGANTLPTAEWSVSTLLDIAGRRMPNHELAISNRVKSPVPRLDISGKTLGVVGTGAIGRTVVALLSGFGMNVLAFDPFPNDAWARENAVSYVPLPELLRESDFISLHAATTERLIGTPELELMKPTTVLVNCARGSLVDNRAVHRAVSQNRIWGYGMDEKWNETDLSLSGLNIAVSPHVGSDTDRGLLGMQELSAQAVEDYFEGRTMISVLNPEALNRR